MNKNTSKPGRTNAPAGTWPHFGVFMHDRVWWSWTSSATETVFRLTCSSGDSRVSGSGGLSPGKPLHQL